MFPYLSVLTVLPLVGALVVAALPRSNGTLAKQVALGVALVELVITAVMLIRFAPHGARMQFHESYPWIPQWGVRFTFATDGIAVVMLALIAILVPVVILAGWHDADSPSGRR